MSQRQHIIPLGHPEPLHHANLGCWCHPLEKENGEIAVHHAKDGREKWERQGIIDQDKPWCIVYEDIPITAMKLFDKLDPRCPQGFTTAGATLFFRTAPTAQNFRVVCRIRNRPPVPMHPALVGLWISLGILAGVLFMLAVTLYRP